MELRIVHVNDTEGPPNEVWPRLATVIRQLRTDGKCDLLLHAGDVPLGAVTTAAGAVALKRLKFDAVAIGNHDLDGGIAQFQARANGLGVPFLCANMTSAPPDCIKPYRWLRRCGLRVVVIGITLPDMPRFLGRRRAAGLTFDPPARVLRDLVPRLRDRADLVVVVSHCGSEEDRELAVQVPGIDLIVGGHDHAAIAQPIPVGRTWMTQAGAGGEYVGSLTIYRVAGRSVVSGGLLSTIAVAPDPVVASLTGGTDADAVGSEVVGYTATDLRESEYAGETPLGNLTVDLIRARAGTEIALLRSASVNNALPPGPIRRRNLAQLNRCGADQIAWLSLSGDDVLRVLECGARESYFLLLTSGARVVYDAVRPYGERVTSVQVGDTPLNLAREYSVACSEIFANGIAGFTLLKDKPREVLPVTVEELLAECITRRGSVQQAVDGRLVIHGHLP